MRFFVRFLAELGAPWTSELLDTLVEKLQNLYQRSADILVFYSKRVIFVEESKI